MHALLSSTLCRKPPETLNTLHQLIDMVIPLAKTNSQRAASDIYYVPAPGSRLEAHCRAAFATLSKLEQDEDFLHFLNSDPHSTTQHVDTPIDAISTLFSSTKSPTPSPPEVFTIGNRPVVLREVPIYWYGDANTLLNIYYSVGNGLRADGTVRFDLALKYYTFKPHDPSTPGQWNALLQAMYEYRSLWLLGHHQRVSDMERVLASTGDETISTVVRQLEEENSASLFRQVLPRAFFLPAQLQARTHPLGLLSDTLQQSRNLEIGTRIAKALRWFGSDKTEICPPEILIKLVWRALWLSIKPTTDSIYDNELKILIEPGIRYAEVRNELVKHYQRSLSISEHGALLALSVAKANIASEIWLDDIPDDLRYGVSSTWVNFKSGFLLAECLVPGSSRHLTFDQLLNLPAEYYSAAEGHADHRALVVLAKVPPTLLWAKAMDLLPVKRTPYSLDEITQATNSLEHHEHEMLEAMQALTIKPPGRFRYASDEEHSKAFYDYLKKPKAAYTKLIKTLIAQIPRSWLEIERDEITVYSLREPLPRTQLTHENKNNTGAVRGRAGFILRINNPRFPNNARYIEVFPGTGLIRLRNDINSLLVGGVEKVKTTGGSTRPSKGTFRVGTELPFDWQAYQKGAAPRPHQKSTLIAETIGHPLLPSPAPANKPSPLTCKLYCANAQRLADMIADEHFLYDETALLITIRTTTQELDLEAYTLERLEYWAKFVLPLWGPIEDLSSGDLERIEAGGLGVFIDIVGFALPIGKYLAGSARLILRSGITGIRNALPKLMHMTRQVLLACLSELNPLDGLLDLYRLARFYSLKLVYASLRRLSVFIDEILPVNRLLSVNPATWSPRQPGDQLFTVNGVPNIPMRNIGTLEAHDFRLIDPASNKVFGPRFREPITVMNNDNPLISQYAVSPLWIGGLKADSRGIFFRQEYNQKFICNVDERGKVAVYQIRENSYGFIKEIAEGSDNSFSVVLVNPKTNRDLPINLSSVEPGHWYSSQLNVRGGAPDQSVPLTPSVLRKWSEFSDQILGVAVKAFVKKNNLDPEALRQFIHPHTRLKKAGQKLLDQEGTARAAVTLADMQRWRSEVRRQPNEANRETFALKYNLDPQEFINLVNKDGSFTPSGRVLEKCSRNESFNPLKAQHLEDWHRLKTTRPSSASMDNFIETNNLNPVLWQTYVDDSGRLTQAGRLVVFFGQPMQTINVARKTVITSVSNSDNLPGPAAKRPAKTQTPPDQPPVLLPKVPDDSFPAPSNKRPGDNLPDPAAKRPAMQTPPDQPPALLPNQHLVNNAAPILQDPLDVTKSLTLTLEGPVDDLKMTDTSDIFHHTIPVDVRANYIMQILKNVKNWVRHEGATHANWLDEMFEVKTLSEGPSRGRSLVAKRDIERFEVLGPYSGRLHLSEDSLRTEMLEVDSNSVSDYLFDTHTQGASISGYGNSNLLSIINAAHKPGTQRIGARNVGAVFVGKYMVFFVSTKKINAGEELLMNYGASYWNRTATPSV